MDPGGSEKPRFWWVIYAKDYGGDVRSTGLRSKANDRNTNETKFIIEDQKSPRNEMRGGHVRNYEEMRLCG